MGKTVRVKEVRKMNKSACGKSGFTLVELSVVLALVAILTTMIVSFYVLMNGFASKSKAEYDFLENHAALKSAVTFWVAENDVTGAEFFVDADGTLTVTKNRDKVGFEFQDGVLSFDGKERAGLGAIDSVEFEQNGSLIKCITKNDSGLMSSFVFLLRSASIVEEAENG